MGRLASGLSGVRRRFAENRCPGWPANPDAATPSSREPQEGASALGRAAEGSVHWPGHFHQLSLTENEQEGTQKAHTLPVQPHLRPWVPAWATPAWSCQLCCPQLAKTPLYSSLTCFPCDCVFAEGESCLFSPRCPAALHRARPLRKRHRKGLAPGRGPPDPASVSPALCTQLGCQTNMLCPGWGDHQEPRPR